MPTPQERIDAANEKLRNGSYTTKEEKISLQEEKKQKINYYTICKKQNGLFIVSYEYY